MTNFLVKMTNICAEKYDSTSHITVFTVYSPLHNVARCYAVVTGDTPGFLAKLKLVHCFCRNDYAVLFLHYWIFILGVPVTVILCIILSHTNNTKCRKAWESIVSFLTYCICCLCYYQNSVLVAIPYL